MQFKIVVQRPNLDSRGYPVRMQGVIERAQHFPKRNIAVAGSCQDDVLKAVYTAKNQGILENVHFIGDIPSTKALMQSQGLNLPTDNMYQITEKDAVAQKAVELVKEGSADFILKGSVSTDVLLGTVIRKGSPLRIEGNVLSSATIASPRFAGDRILLFADATFDLKAHKDDGKTPDEVKTFERYVGAIKNMAALANKVLGMTDIRVAIMSYTEQLLEKPDIDEVRALSERARPILEGLYIGPVSIYGPLSLDVAVSPDSAKNKGADKLPVAGNANILFWRHTETANAIYKALQLQEEIYANVVLGAKIPIAVPSRSDSHFSKLMAISACSCYLG